LAANVESVNNGLVGTAITVRPVDETSGHGNFAERSEKNVRRHGRQERRGPITSSVHGPHLTALTRPDGFNSIGYAETFAEELVARLLKNERSS